jgi:anaerobic selenocysteine-containing dehydrogenase
MIKSHVRDGVITRISARSDKELDEANPYMKACVRGRSYRKNQYHPDRLKYPMPLQCITWKGRNRANSTFANHPWLKEVAEQVLWINPTDAEQRGI